MVCYVGVFLGALAIAADPWNAKEYCKYVVFRHACLSPPLPCIGGEAVNISSW